MEKRTNDLEGLNSQKFFADPELSAAVTAYFSGKSVQDKVAEGYERYSFVISEAIEKAPEEDEIVVAEVAEKLHLYRNEYDQAVLDSFKERVAEIMLPASVYIPIKELLMNLFEDQENENLMLLVMTSMDDILDNMTNCFANFVALLTSGVPIEIAEEIVADFGDSEIIPIGIQITTNGDDDDDVDFEEEKSECCGECGGRCDCQMRELCEEEGHCQYD